jgi:hypothetical protein
MFDGQVYHTYSDILVENVEGELKREMSKYKPSPGGYDFEEIIADNPHLIGCTELNFAFPRIFTTYDEGAIYCKSLPDMIKVCLDGWHAVSNDFVDSLIYCMAKPKEGDLDTVFSKALSCRNETNRVFWGIYSDDSLLSGNINGMPFCYNADLKSSDSSQLELTAYVVFKMMKRLNPHLAEGLIKQLLQPIKMTNPYNEDEFFFLQFDGLNLGSGSLLTTVMNHVGSILGALSVSALINHEYNRITNSTELERIIIQGYKNVGLQIELASCERRGVFEPSLMQFVKHSYLSTDKDIRVPCLNYGCIFRSLGTVRTEPTYISLGMSLEQFQRASHLERMNRFCSGVINSHCHQPRSRIMDALRARFPPQSDNFVTSYDTSNNDFIPAPNRSDIYITDEGIIDRYDDISMSDLTDLVNAILEVDLGGIYPSAACSSFYKEDYGVPDNWTH